MSPKVRAAASAAALAAACLWACHLGPEEEAHFDLDADSAWLECARLEVVLQDGEGAVLDTLFRDTLASLAPLQALPAARYPGGAARVHILGFHADGSLCLEQIRSFEAGGSRMVVDTVRDPGAMPREVELEVETIDLAAGGALATPGGRVVPAYADQGLVWTVDSSGVASLESPAGGSNGPARVRAGKAGEAWLTASSRKDPSVTSRVRIRVGNEPPRILSRRGDTAISIGDSLPMPARARDADNPLAWIGWDYDMDGRFDDSADLEDSVGEIYAGRRFLEPGIRKAVLKVVDRYGGVRLDTATITVETDPPAADAGPDFAVLAGAAVRLVAGGSDRLGTVVRREISVAGSPFALLSGGDTSFAAPLEPAVLRCVVRVTDDDGLADEDTAFITVLLSSNADLARLELSVGALDPEFRPTTQLYSVRLPFADSVLRVVPEARSPAATLTVNGASTRSGEPSGEIRVPVGANLNSIQVVVTAPDGGQRVYSLTVVRDASPEASLAGLDAVGARIRPAFAVNRFDYLDTVPHAISSLVLKPVLAAAGAKATVAGRETPSGQASGPVPLDVGDNVIPVMVTSPNGNASTLYRVRIVRLARLLVYRKEGDLAPALVDSADLPLGASRAVSVAAPEGFRFLRWGAMEGVEADDTASASTRVAVRSGQARVQADFTRKTYDLLASANAGGTIVPAGKVTVTHGQSQAYTIRPQAGYKILAVRVDGESDPSGLDGSLLLDQVSSGHTIEAVFGRTFALTSTTSSGGTVQPLGVVAVDEGQDMDYTITPFAGYRIHSVLVDGTDSASAHHGSFTFAKVSAHHTLEARFIRTYPVTAEVETGRGTVVLPSPRADSGAAYTLVFKPDPGYRLLAVFDNGAQVAPNGGDTAYTVTGVREKHDVRVRFLRRYSLRFLPSPGGSPSADILSVDSGTSATPKLTLMHNSGYRFDSLWINGVKVDVPVGRSGPYGQHDYSLPSFTEDKVVLARFRRYYPVSAIIASGMASGTATPMSAFVDSGTAHTVTLSPSPGWVLTSVKDNGAESLSRVDINSYTLTADTAHSLAIAFTAGATHPVAITTDVEPVAYRASVFLPRVCVEMGGKTACGENQLSLDLPAGAEIRLVADPAYTVCGMAGCNTVPWRAWQGGDLGGQPMRTAPFRLSAPMTVKALYNAVP